MPPLPTRVNQSVEERPQRARRKAQPASSDKRMNTTPLWVPLVVAAMGLVGTVAGTVGGVLITQLMAKRRETANA